MKNILFAIIVSLAFAACTTLETYVPNADADYEMTLITLNQGFFRKPKLIMGEYSLVLDREFSESLSIIYYYHKAGGRYSFYKGDVKLYTVEIVTTTEGVGSDESHIGSVKRAIEFSSADNSKRETYTMEENVEAKWVTYSDSQGTSTLTLGGLSDKTERYTMFNDYDTIGIITFDTYRSRNKNAPDAEWEYDTGLNVRINEQDYGVLALYPPALYRRRSAVELNDRLVLYIMVSYESHRQNYQ